MKSQTKKRQEAEARKSVRSKRTSSQQLALLSKRPGNAVRERKRLAAK